MSCPPTHFRRSLTSPSVLKRGLAGPETPGEAGAVIMRISPRGDDTAEQAQRGRTVLRERARTGRRSVTTGTMASGSASRGRGIGGRSRARHGRATVQASEGEPLAADGEAWLDSRAHAVDTDVGMDVVGASGEATGDELLLSLDSPSDYLQLRGPSIPDSWCLTDPTYDKDVGQSLRRPSTFPAPPVFAAASRTHRSRLPPPSPPDPTFAFAEPFDEDEVSPFFSPEYHTARHVSLFGAGGGSSVCTSSTARPQSCRVSYDVPDEYEAWDAAMRCLSEADARADEWLRDGVGGGGGKGRTGAARRRLEMVRMQLGG